MKTLLKAALLLTLSTGYASADLVNPGFETGDLSGWSNIGGNASITSTGTNIGGNYQLQINNDHGTSNNNLASVETTLGLTAGTLSGFVMPSGTVPNVTDASFEYQSFAGYAGETIIIHSHFSHNDGTYDAGFVTLSGPATNNITLVGSAVNLGDVTTTLTLSSSGTYILGLGVTNTGDEEEASTMLFDIGYTRAEMSAQTYGLAFANAENQAVLGATQTVTNDINNHLFMLRAGGGEEDSDGSIDEGVVTGQGDGPDKNPIAQRIKRSRQWEAFATVNYGNVRLNPISNQAGVQIDSWASGAGVERHLSRGLTLGFALSFLQSQQNYSNSLGNVNLEGPALSTYLAYARKNVWASLLYSFGDYNMGTSRNPGLGFASASGSTTAYTNSVQFNTGYSFRFQNNTLVTGPFVGVDYLHGTIDAYRETGGGLAALAFGRQTFQSLVSRVGWSASKTFTTNWATIIPQLRFSYERQNLHNNGTSVSLINAPFTAAGGNQTPGQDYMVLGTGVSFQFTDQWSLLLGYQTQLFRNNMSAHFGSVRIGYKF